jgi:CRISPR-associated protein Cmr2
MSLFWQAKIWALLHDPVLKSLHSNFADEGVWKIFKCMENWRSPKDPASHSQTELNSTWLKYVGLCDLLSSSSDRSSIGRLPALESYVKYDKNGLEITHLLSGESQFIKLEQWHQHILDKNEDNITGWESCVIPDFIKDCDDPKKVFWWLWRCYIPALSHALGGEGEEANIHLLPAETRLPDASLWSHVTMTSALAGGLAGYYQNPDDYPKKGDRVKGKESRPYVASFTFTPVQDLIKASRKMRDFWAGSWLLHYLSARVCWAIAQKYGPDTFLYPCLYEQPLIDHFLLQEYDDFKQWIKPPSEQQLLTAGFPNVLVMILPNNGKTADDISGNPVYAALRYAEETLKDEWKNLGTEVLEFLQENNSQWQNINRHTWDDWLKSVWQIYWAALPIGEISVDLDHSPRKEDKYHEWIKQENDFSQPVDPLFDDAEFQFLEAIFKITIPADPETDNEPIVKFRARQPNMNVGSWWPYIFDQLRFSVNGIKNARTWQIPTAFGPRSTISGIGSVVHPIYDHEKPDWATEGQTKDFWLEKANLFDGIEELNATEVLKRGLHQVLGEILGIKSKEQRDKITMLYPDLSSGVAGWIKTNPDAIAYFQKACESIIKDFSWAKKAGNLPWGIPYIDDDKLPRKKLYHPRLLNAGWLIEDFANQDQERKNQELQELKTKIAEFFNQGNNPTDWYVLAAGDGDSMSEWLKGAKLHPYSNYIPDALKQKIPNLRDNIKGPFEEFLQVTKRMGPATHSALSRALLDFSNQLVPYITETRYSGRLIYSGGDDVLSYTNLWEWDNWLWDIRECFRGSEDPQNEFTNDGDYWQWNDGKKPENLSNRPLFTMGSKATISFGLVIAHHSVPLAIALEHLWKAEEKAKEHKSADHTAKDALQVRVLYGNGNVLKSTAKFDVFYQWKQLLTISQDLESSIFELAAEMWEEHPAPNHTAISLWSQVFCDRRDFFKNNPETKDIFQEYLTNFLETINNFTDKENRDREIYNWLKLAAFVLRNRDIKWDNKSGGDN